MRMNIVAPPSGLPGVAATAGDGLAPAASAGGFDVLMALAEAVSAPAAGATQPQAGQPPTVLELETWAFAAEEAGAELAASSAGDKAVSPPETAAVPATSAAARVAPQRPPAAPRSAPSLTPAPASTSARAGIAADDEPRQQYEVAPNGRQDLQPSARRGEDEGSDTPAAPAADTFAQAPPPIAHIAAASLAVTVPASPLAPAAAGSTGANSEAEPPGARLPTAEMGTRASTEAPADDRGPAPILGESAEPDAAAPPAPMARPVTPSAGPVPPTLGKTTASSAIALQAGASFESARPQDRPAPAPQDPARNGQLTPPFGAATPATAFAAASSASSASVQAPAPPLRPALPARAARGERADTASETASPPGLGRAPQAALPQAAQTISKPSAGDDKGEAAGELSSLGGNGTSPGGPSEDVARPLEQQVSLSDTRGAAPAVTPVRGAPETIAHLAAQILKKLEGQVTRFDIELTPHGLGKVDIRIEINAQGQLAAAMSFDNPQAAQEVRSRSADLQRALEASGFDLAGGLAFDLADDHSSRNPQGWEEQAAQGRAQRGKAFMAALSGAAEADAPPGGPQLRRAYANGFDVRV